MTHTPVPWFAVYNDVYWTISIGPDRYSQNLALTQQNKYIPIDAETEKANAEFIVRACNAHDELVAALNTIAHDMNVGESGDASLMASVAGKVLAKVGFNHDRS